MKSAQAIQIVLPSDLGSPTLGRWVEATARLDRAGYGLILLEGAHAEDPLDTLSIAAYCATATRHIGLCASVDTTMVEPFTFARGLATLDHLSGGRAAWRCIGDGDGNRVAEFVEVVAKLLTSWDKDALIERHEDGLLSDETAVHPIHHNGAHFFSRGPLNMPQPPQGVPPLVALDSDPVRPKAGLLIPDEQLIRCSINIVEQLGPPIEPVSGGLLRDRLGLAS